MQEEITNQESTLRLNFNIKDISDPTSPNNKQNSKTKDSEPHSSKNNNSSKP